MHTTIYSLLSSVGRPSASSVLPKWSRDSGLNPRDEPELPKRCCGHPGLKLPGTSKSTLNADGGGAYVGGGNGGYV